jgi:hypothetical protein
VIVAGCASDNPFFDPSRQSDTTGEDTSTSGGDDIGPDEADSGADSGSGSEEDTGTITPAICNSPELELEVSMMADDVYVLSCGQTSSARCTMYRDAARPEGRWQLIGCDNPLGETDATEYVVGFSPTGPSLDFSDQRLVEVAWRHGPKDGGCPLEWIQIRELEVKTGAPFDLIYVAAAALTDDSALVVHAQPTELVAECTCASNELDCCPPDAGLHGLQLSVDGVPGITLESGDTPAIVDAGGHQFEAILVRAWQPPVCATEPEYQWITRRLTQ